MSKSSPKLEGGLHDAEPSGRRKGRKFLSLFCLAPNNHAGVYRSLVGVSSCGQAARQAPVPRLGAERKYSAEWVAKVVVYGSSHDPML